MQEIYDTLDQLAIPYEKFEHPPVFTCEEADKFNAEMGCGHSKNLFLRNKKGNQHYLVVVESHRPFNIKKFAELIDDKKISFASPERLEKYLRTTPGSVSVYGIIYDQENHVKVFVDEELFKHDTLGYHPNSNDATLVISSADLPKYLDHSGNQWEKIKIPE